MEKPGIPVLGGVGVVTAVHIFTKPEYCNGIPVFCLRRKFGNVMMWKCDDVEMWKCEDVMMG
jgi:hypothetical protein